MTDIVADICVYACTGKYGSRVAHLICELAERDEQTTLLLAGRNLDKVQALREELVSQARQGEQGNVRVLVHPEAVDVDNTEALYAMASRAHVVANCVKLEAHPRACTAVAEACSATGSHYLDVATTLTSMAPIFASTPSSSESKLVPGCGFDYAFFDVAVDEALQALKSTHGEAVSPEKLQLVLAVRPGPLGFKWLLDSVDSYFKVESRARQSEKIDS